jgi:hypothetical protein
MNSELPPLLLLSENYISHAIFLVEANLGVTLISGDEEKGAKP